MHPSDLNAPDQAPVRREATSAIHRAEPVFWRVEGSLLNLTAVRPVGFFTWNAQSFLERWMRRGTMGVLAIARPFFYLSNRVFATRCCIPCCAARAATGLICWAKSFFNIFSSPA